MKRFSIVFVCLVVTASVAFAHQNVKNPAVKARMDSMAGLASNMKTLGGIAKGAAAFDPETVHQTLLEIANGAASTPDLFRDAAADPVSEALPLIWVDFDDFSARSEMLRTLALQLAGSISDQADVGPAMVELGGACRSCHGKYRE